MVGDETTGSYMEETIVHEVNHGKRLWHLQDRCIICAGNCDFELKNGSGFYLQGFIAGERFEPTTTPY